MQGPRGQESGTARLRGHVHGEGGRGGGPEGGARRAGLSSQINTNGIAPSNGNSSRFGEQDVPAKLPASAGSPPCATPPVCGRVAPRRPPLSRGVPPVCVPAFAQSLLCSRRL